MNFKTGKMKDPKVSKANNKKGEREQTLIHKLRKK